MLLIYTHKITPRLTYVMKQVLQRILGLEFTLTTRIEDFIKHSGPKMTYTSKPLQKEFFMQSHPLLFDEGIKEYDIEVLPWDDLPTFFPTSQSSIIPFDLFAASFYLLTRYEEYLPFKADQHGRFPATSSIAFKHDFLHLPLVDLWAWKWVELLKEKFPEIAPVKSSVGFTPVVNVTTSHCFAHRGMLRGFAGLMIDLGYFRLRRVIDRIAVVLLLKKDPFDNFDKLVEVLKKFRTKSIFFFQFAQYSKHDKNISPENNKFRSLIKFVADYAEVGLAASHRSQSVMGLLKEEKEQLSAVIHRPINSVRMRYNRVEIPASYRDLIHAEITQDYTMGYTHYIGFKASTCTPFFFYDLGIEAKQPVRIHPFSVHDYALQGYTKIEKMLSEIGNAATQVRRVGGSFIIVFSNENLGGSHRVDWLDLYERVIEQYHV